MPLPSKQKTIYEYLIADIQDHFYPGAKLPSELEYCRRIGVARETLRATLRRLQEEKRIVRNKTGTYVCGRATGLCPGISGGSGPVHVLVPCPDYTFISGRASVYAHQKMILGAMQASVRYGTQALTIPVSETNNPDDINWNQLAGLRENDIVLFTGTWFRRVVPLLAERRCRIGCIVDSIEELELVSGKADYFVYTRDVLWNIFPDAVEFLVRNNKKKIACFAVDRSFYEPDIKGWFESNMKRFGLSSENMFGFAPLEKEEPLNLSGAAEFCAGREFDALILLVLFPFRKYEIADLYRTLNLPVSKTILINNTSFLNGREPARNANLILCHDTFQKSAMKLADFFLSGGRGQTVQRFEYEFLTGKELHYESKSSVSVE